LRLVGFLFVFTYTPYVILALPAFLFPCIVFLKRYGEVRWIPNEEGKNPYWLGIFSASYIISGLVYFTYLEPFGIYSIYDFMFIIFNVIWLILYIRIVIMDPGIIPKNSVSHEEIINAYKQDKQWKYCLTCRCKKPIRAKHCRTCDQCVAKFDHYCPWINNDVGFYNNRLFYLVVIGVCINHTSFIYFCYSYLLEHSPAVSLLSLIPMLYDQQTIIFVLFLYHIFMSTWQWYTFAFTSYLIAMNITTNEKMNEGRYKYLWNGSQFYNPFNKGTLGNIYEFFFFYCGLYQNYLGF